MGEHDLQRRGVVHRLGEVAQRMRVAGEADVEVPPVLEKRVQILAMLCEGSSMRSISRVCDVSINTVAKLLEDAGKVCTAFHDLSMLSDFRRV